jgi:membrane peptidoglycan carboxypeptidase
MSIESANTSRPFAQSAGQPSSGRRCPRWRLVARIIRAGLAICLLGMVLGGVAGWWYLASLPSVADAQQRVAAIVRARHGVEVSLPLPQKVTQATVAVEDQRFYTNHGIDIISMAHFTWGFITTGSTQEGGATITEQLAKILYVRQPATPAGKLEMIGMAPKLNQRYSKERILAMYLSVIYYGHQAYGLPQASETYFHTSPDRLTWGEASLLAGLPQAPSAYDPFTHYDLARARQRHVLSRLVATGVLTPEQAASAYADTPTFP